MPRPLLGKKPLSGAERVARHRRRRKSHALFGSPKHRHVIAPDDEMERRGYDQALADLVMRLKQVIADLPPMPGEPNRSVVMHRMGLERAISAAEELCREKRAEIGQ
jgi:hypothetical protein